MKRTEKEISRVTRKDVNSRVSEATMTSSTDGIAWAFEVEGVVNGLPFYAVLVTGSGPTWRIDKDYNFTSAQKSAIRRACNKLNDE